LREGEEVENEGAVEAAAPRAAGLGLQREPAAEVPETEAGRALNRAFGRGEPFLGGDDGAGQGDTNGEEAGARGGSERIGRPFARGEAGRREGLLGRRRRREGRSTPCRQEDGEDERGEPAIRQEGTGPRASGFPSARIRTSSSWKKSAVVRTLSGVLST
jgi:hypothetical protein